MVEQLRAVPGVESAALIRGLPLTGNSISVRIILPERETPPRGQEPQVLYNTATPDYFATMSIPFVQGRLFNDGDHLDTPAVIIINQMMARRYWPGQDPIGRQIKFVGGDGTPATIIGVVGDAKHDWLSEEQRPQVYDCYSQSPGLFATVVVPHEGRAVEPLPIRARGRVEGGQGPAGVEGADGRITDGVQRRRQAFPDAVDGRLRGARPSHHLHRPVRGHELHGRAEDARDRRPHGPRGARRRCVEVSRLARDAAGVGGGGRRVNRVFRLDPVRTEPALRG